MDKKEAQFQKWKGLADRDRKLHTKQAFLIAGMPEELWERLVEECEWLKPKEDVIPGIRDIFLDLIRMKRPKQACHYVAEELLNKYELLTISDTNEIYIYLDGVYSPRAMEFILRDLQTILLDQCCNHFVNEIIGHLRRSTIKNRKFLREDQDKLCLENGILDLNTLEISPHDAGIIFFNKLPVIYDPKAKCPNIEKFLSEIVLGEDIVLLKEFAGYCLYKEHFIHKSFMLCGSGANGKSTFLRLLKEFLGQENVSSVPLQRLENNRFSLSSLFGKLANIFADLPARALAGTSIFKMLVGQDLIPAEKKFKDEFFFENYAKMIFSANQIPKSPEDTDAFFRRWIIVNFPNQFINSKADKHLIKKITTPEELSGFLNVAIQGLKDLLERGDFSKTDSIEATREQYIRLSDSVGAFVMDHVEAHPEEFVQKKELYTAYCDYCREIGAPAVAENTFHRELQKKLRVEDYRPSLEVDGKKERVQCWKGITLILHLNTRKNPDNPDNPDITRDSPPRDVNPVNHVKDISLLKCNIANTDKLNPFLDDPGP